MQQLLWIETLLKFGAGLLLLLAPRNTIRLFGLPQATNGFWPRLLGTLLIGLAGATFLEGSHPGSRGLGLAGCLIVNFSAVALITATLAFDAGPVSARGRAVMWLLVVLLLWLCALEIANL